MLFIAVNANTIHVVPENHDVVTRTTYISFLKTIDNP